jgi:hypothetical protein
MKKDALSLSTYPRSPEWDRVKRRFKKTHPTCAVCGSRKRLTVHHIIPYHLRQELELEESNLITLCEEGCHFLIGHWKSWKSWNKTMRADAEWLNERIKTRPKPWEVDEE